MSGIAENIERAFIVPGLPHLAYNNDGWQELKAAYKKAGESIQAMNPDVLVIYSSQWISVLGHSFQADPNPKARSFCLYIMCERDRNSLRKKYTYGHP